MNNIWRDLPHDLFVHVRRQADVQSWTAIDVADVQCRRSLAKSIEPAIHRVRQLMRYLYEHEVKRNDLCVLIKFPDETVELRLSRYPTAWRMVSNSRAEITLSPNGVDNVLGLVAPLARRAMDRGEVWMISLHRHKARCEILSYCSPKFHPPQQLENFRSRGSFLSRLEMFLQLLEQGLAVVIEYRLGVEDRMVRLAHAKSGTFDIRIHDRSGVKVYKGLQAGSVLKHAKHKHAQEKVWSLSLCAVVEEIVWGEVSTCSGPFWDLISGHRLIG